MVIPVSKGRTHARSSLGVLVMPTDTPSNIDIYQTANELIKQHGEDATIHAAMRADELLDAGDINGQAVWKQILAAIEELLSGDRPKDVSLH